MSHREVCERHWHFFWGPGSLHLKADDWIERHHPHLQSIEIPEEAQHVTAVAYCDNGRPEYLFETCVQYSKRMDVAAPCQLSEWHMTSQYLLIENCYLMIHTKRKHRLGCLQSESPSVVINRRDSLIESLYFRHCSGLHLNILGGKLQV